MLSTEELLDILNNFPGGYKSADDDFFANANTLLFPVHKKLGVIVHVEDDEQIEQKVEHSPSKNKDMYCNEPGCNMMFDSVNAFQSHFNSMHRFNCGECKRTLPTAHLLDLHLMEQHDSYFAARVARSNEPMYACYLEECKQKMVTPEERKEHCVKEHKFPGNYRFDQLKTKPNGRKDKHNERKCTTAQVEKSMEVDGAEAFVAPAVQRIKAFSFGHHPDKVFNTKSLKSREDGETLKDLDDLKNALADVI